MEFDKECIQYFRRANMKEKDCSSPRRIWEYNIETDLK